MSHSLIYKIVRSYFNHNNQATSNNKYLSDEYILTCFSRLYYYNGNSLWLPIRCVSRGIYFTHSPTINTSFSLNRFTTSHLHISQTQPIDIFLPNADGTRFINPVSSTRRFCCSNIYIYVKIFNLLAFLFLTPVRTSILKHQGRIL